SIPAPEPPSNPQQTDLAHAPTILPTPPPEPPPVTSSPESLLPTMVTTPQITPQATPNTAGWKQAVLMGGLIGGSILTAAILIRAELPRLLNASQPEPTATPTVTPETVEATTSENTGSIPDSPPVRAANPNAPTNAVIVGEPGNKNIRSGPGTSQGVRGQVGTGNRVQIVRTGRDANGYPWHEIFIPASGRQGWIAAHLVASDSEVQPTIVKPKPDSSEPDNPEPAAAQTPAETVSQPKSPATSQVPQTNATIAGEPGSKNIRSGPGTGFSVRFETNTGSRAKIMSQRRDRDGYLWYQVYIPNANAQGWIAAQLVSLD
ncbi:MAG: hypothetical protein WA902_03895, partial [Thermosynechococcaceae cyanobacterium]